MGIFDIFGGDKKAPAAKNEANEKPKQDAPKPVFKERNWDNPSEETMELERMHAELNK